MMKRMIASLCLGMGCSALVAAPEPAFRDLYSDTWVATDSQGRSLPGVEECGPPRADRTVGIFYFLWQGQHGTQGPYDNTKILAGDPDNLAWGPLKAFHFWGEPELGYYVSTDQYVIRRHAQWLTDAGVQALFFDVTNGLTYPRAYLAVCEVFAQMRKEGYDTPQIAFLTNAASERVVKQLYDDFYNKNLYPDLWFRWDGKPLILSKTDGLEQPLLDFFTFRQSWAWSAARWFGDGKDKWPWLDHTPQKPGWHEPGVAEEVPVATAQHATTSIGRSYQNGKEPAQPQPEKGLYFTEQWESALKTDPRFVFITGWNEWVAMRFVTEKPRKFAGGQIPAGGTYFVDQYNHEYSRDIEPMKGGHTDDYYYQMVANIRRYKGVRPLPLAGAPVTVGIDGDFSDWDAVTPEYRDRAFDTVHRNSQGWGDAGMYVNTTGRNDFVTLKAARDADNLYFMAETREAITDPLESNWMMLFVDADRNPATGWEGYDYLVNARRATNRRGTVEKLNAQGEGSEVGQAEFSVNGNRMEMSVPRALLGLNAEGPVSFDFHWADNIQQSGEILEFAINGDSAPDRRFNYRYAEPHP